MSAAMKRRWHTQKETNGAFLPITAVSTTTRINIASLDATTVASLDNTITPTTTAITTKRLTNTRMTTVSSIMTPYEKQRHINISKKFSYIITAIVMIFIGWQLCAYHQKYKNLNGDDDGNYIIKDPPWWIEDTVDDFFSRTYLENGSSPVRKLNNSNFFTGLCGRYRFNDTKFPTISIIVTVQNEQPGMLTLTIKTLLAKTPPSILKQIVIVDDNGTEDVDFRKKSIDESEIENIKKLDDKKILIIKNVQREGVARSRVNGARKSNGEILIFVDSHVEMLSSTWAQHLIIPILENERTLSSQTLDILNDVDWSYGSGSGDLLYGVITDDFWFAYQRSRFSNVDNDGLSIDTEKPGRRLHYETPFVPGSLFAIQRKWFFKIGGYDEGMYVWGGENTDFAIKSWCCGGRIVMVPCSRVGHMYRLHNTETGNRWPPEISNSLMKHLKFTAFDKINHKYVDNFTKIISRNNIRVLERWAKHEQYARKGYYKKIFGNESLTGIWKQIADDMDNDKDALFQKKVINDLGCKSFQWFDTHVYYKLTGFHHPWHPTSIGHRTWV